jgi:glycyl-tRNA synthetase (class II)
MKVSLNKANKLRNSLEALVIPLTLSYSVRTDLISLEEFKKNREIFEKELKNKLSRDGAVAELRTIIHDASFKSGATKLIAEISLYERSLKTLAELTGFFFRGSGSSYDDAVASIKYKTELAARDPQYVKGPERVQVSLVLPKDLEECVGITKAIKLKLEDAKEKRNEINHKTVIELPEDIVGFLREHFLLKA